MAIVASAPNHFKYMLATKKVDLVSLLWLKFDEKQILFSLFFMQKSNCVLLENSSENHF
jgi:hypothetical protein